MRTRLLTEAHNAITAMEPMQVSSSCTVDGCYRETRFGVVGKYCEKHYLNLRRSGHIRPQKYAADWVSDSAGPECGVCGRSVYEHGVTEFCQQIVREMAS